MKIFNFINPKSIQRKLIIIILITNLIPTILLAQDISTIGEIYDFEVNDIFHHEFYGGSGMYGVRWITNIEIIDKYYSVDSNSVYYVIDYARKVISSENPFWIYTYGVDTMHYSNIDSLINGGEIDAVYSNNNLYNGRLINEYEYDDGDVYYNTKYVVGCGSAYWYSINSGGGESSDYLVYYKKGSEIWGQPLIVDIEDYESKDYELLIYPNPASSTVYIEASKPIKGHVEIYSMKGIYIDKVELKAELKNIDISKLNTGSYILKFCLTDRMIYKKIIKK